ncbi:MAG: SDR family NAD(P)-dependent oxidoreductase [Candidatus Omnitrophica bacterium]|nr:SDR family NAD(P)-dependent oxidoreductase [Candidatus Omnitrophota bacterium]MDD5429931.1 SDR family NAD(P)-dependent oxidoreductase [Candidatus Omnitrophota bacterium]
MEKFNWNGKKVLVTGAGGFIGSHLAECLVKLGAKVRALVHYNSFGRWGWLDESDHKTDMEVILGDIADRDSVAGAVSGQEIVFHLAALIGIPYSYQAVNSYVQANILGTVNVLQAARQSNISCLVHTSTSETYGTAQYVPINEKHPAVGQSPYSATKIGADQIALSFQKSFSLPVKIARPFNTYGPRQSARAIIPAIIIQILNGKREINLGSLSPKRDFIYVKDTARGFIEIAESKSLIGEAANIGSGSEISIGNLAELIASLMGEKIEIAKDASRLRPDDSEVQRLCCDNTKLRQNSSWHPEYSLEKGLDETIKWFRANLKRYKADIYNV